MLVVAAGSHLVARPVKGFVEHGDDDEHLLVTIGDLFWTSCNFDHFYPRPFRVTATTAEQTRQAETEAGVTWFLRGSGCLVTSLEPLQVPLQTTDTDAEFFNTKRIFLLQNQVQDLNSNLVYHHITIVFSGEISLRGNKRPIKADGHIVKGNVYLDGHPICDDGWTREDATVACR